jgi:hypothetical protein
MFIKNKCLNGIKVSKKGDSRYKTMNGRLEAVSSIQHTVTRELKAIREEVFSRTFDSLYERCKRYA